MQYKFAVITDVWNLDFVSFFHAVLSENWASNRLTPLLVGNLHLGNSGSVTGITFCCHNELR